MTFASPPPFLSAYRSCKITNFFFFATFRIIVQERAIAPVPLSYSKKKIKKFTTESNSFLVFGMKPSVYDDPRPPRKERKRNSLEESSIRDGRTGNSEIPSQTFRRLYLFRTEYILHNGTHAFSRSTAPVLTGTGTLPINNQYWPTYQHVSGMITLIRYRTSSARPVPFAVFRGLSLPVFRQHLTRGTGTDFES